MNFSKLSGFFQQIENTSSRLEITRHLSNLYKDLTPSEIQQTTYLLQGRLGPLYSKLEFGIAEKTVIKAVTLALQIDKTDFMKLYNKIGDVGEAVEHFKKEIHSIEEEEISIKDVYDALYKLAQSAGSGSQEKKVSILSYLIRRSDPVSSRYLVRIPLGVMRLGFSDMTVLDALSWMAVGDKRLRPEIQKAYHVHPDLGLIGRLMKEKGVKALNKITPLIFTPILMMRAERLPSTEEIIKKIGTCLVESKYDGFRLQVHYQKATHTVKLYSRNLDEVSFMYPDLIEGVKKEIKCKSDVILEGEAIGFDPQTGSFLPFQETVSRKRKYGIEDKVKEIPLKLFAFDLLYMDGESCINVPFASRRKKLEKIIHIKHDVFVDTIIPSECKEVSTGHAMELLFDDAISRGLEGIIAKKIDGVYSPGARGWNWIKFKRSYSSKIEDTIDMLVMGYDFGRGKRTSFGIGAFLVGVLDAKSDTYVTMAKIGTGLTDDEWRTLRTRAEKYKTTKKPSQYDVDSGMNVDQWVSPELVVEIKADEITRSPVHTAGRKLKTSKSGQALEIDVPGYALRFPRLEHFREDKRPEDITSLSEVAKMFKAQGK